MRKSLNFNIGSIRVTNVLFRLTVYLFMFSAALELHQNIGIVILQICENGRQGSDYKFAAHPEDA